MQQFSDLAHQSGSKTRLIYWNNHFNAWYGALCFDPLFEDWIHEERKQNQTFQWEIFDTRRVFKFVWKEQNYDRFQFNREMHVWSTRQWGKLEIQLAQSLLNFLIFSPMKSLTRWIVKENGFLLTLRLFCSKVENNWLNDSLIVRSVVVFWKGKGARSWVLFFEKNKN